MYLTITLMDNSLSFSIRIGLLVVAIVCNELIRPVASKWHEPERDSTKTVKEEAVR